MHFLISRTAINKHASLTPGGISLLRHTNIFNKWLSHIENIQVRNFRVPLNATNNKTFQKWLLPLSLSLSLWCNNPNPVRADSFFTFLHHTRWHTTVCRTPLDEGSALRTDYITPTKISMLTAGFELAIPASDRPQTLLLDRSRSRTGNKLLVHTENIFLR
jgi:hypothetical protein